MEQVRNNQANQIRSTGDEAACRQIRLIVKFLYARQHSLASFVSHIRMIPKDLGNGHDRNPKVFRNVLHSCGHDLSASIQNTYSCNFIPQSSTTRRDAAPKELRTT